MRDVEHDTNIHKKARTIGDKDAHYINKSIWLDSKTLGYGSDGGSKGSSHGYRSKSDSSGSSFEILSRPKRRTHHSPSPKSSSSSSSIPSLSSTKFTNYSRTTSLNSDATNNPSPSSTATSKRKRQ